MNIEIELTPEGGVAMLHDDAVDLHELGDKVSVTRASNVEFVNGDESVVLDGQLWTECWYVQSAATSKVLAAGFRSRAEALAWEKTYYSPSGAGWAELTGGK